MNLYPASLGKVCSILGIGSASKTVILFKTIKSVKKWYELPFFFTITTGEQYGLPEHSTTPKSIIDLISSPTVSSILNGNGYCLICTGVCMVNLMSWSNKVVLPGLSENVSENSCTREVLVPFLQCLNFDWHSPVNWPAYFRATKFELALLWHHHLILLTPYQQLK